MDQDIEHLEQIKKLSKELEPKWVTMKTIDPENSKDRLKISAQGCNPQTPTC